MSELVPIICKIGGHSFKWGKSTTPTTHKGRRRGPIDANATPSSNSSSKPLNNTKETTGLLNTSPIFILKGDTVATIIAQNGVESSILAPISGMLEQKLVEDGSNVDSDTQIASISPCKHFGVYNCMCIACGEVLPPSFCKSASMKPNVIGGKQLLCSQEETKRSEDNRRSALLKSKKIALVLDLDLTIIHAYRFDCLGVVVPVSINENGRLVENFSTFQYVQPSLEQLGPDVHVITLMESQGPKDYVIKLRPMLREFLSRAAELCQLSIYTAATRDYALAVVKVIDPENKYFHGRIVTRSDVTSDDVVTVEQGMDILSVPKKDLTNLYQTDHHMVVVLDDRVDAWKESQSDHILAVKPFCCNAFLQYRIDGPPSPPSSFAITMSGENPGLRVEGSEVAEFDDQLNRSLAILQDIHAKFYPSDVIHSGSLALSTTENSNNNNNNSNNNDDVLKSLATPSIPRLLRSFRSRVLRGCVVVFSGLVSKYLPLSRNEAWLNAKQLGARVDPEVSAQTTHLISASPTTSEAQECVRRGNIWILHSHWLNYCRWSLSKVNEASFTLVELDVNNYPSPKLIDVEEKDEEMIDAQRNGLISRKRKSSFDIHPCSSSNRSDCEEQKSRRVSFSLPGSENKINKDSDPLMDLFFPSDDDDDDDDSDDDDNDGVDNSFLDDKYSSHDKDTCDRNSDDDSCTGNKSEKSIRSNDFEDNSDLEIDSDIEFA